MIKLFHCHRRRNDDDDVEDTALDLKPPTGHSKAGAMLSKCIDWFEVQEEAYAAQISLLREKRNTAAQKTRASK